MLSRSGTWSTAAAVDIFFGCERCESESAVIPPNALANYALLIEREEVVEDHAGNEDVLSHDDNSVKTMGMSCYSA
jgi:hypothetical protein